MEEAQQMCGRVGIMDHGKIIALDTPQSMIDSLGGDIVAIRAASPPLESIRSLPGVSSVQMTDGLMEVTMKSAHLHLAALLGLIPDVHSVEMRKPTLNDVFMKLTGRDIREDGAARGESWVETAARHQQRGR